jgi:hypothetical protein
MVAAFAVGAAIEEEGFYFANLAGPATCYGARGVLALRARRTSQGRARRSGALLILIHDQIQQRVNPEVFQSLF